MMKKVFTAAVETEAIKIVGDDELDRFKAQVHPFRLSAQEVLIALITPTRIPSA